MSRLVDSLLSRFGGRRSYAWDTTLSYNVGKERWLTASSFIAGKLLGTVHAFSSHEIAQQKTRVFGVARKAWTLHNRKNGFSNIHIYDEQQSALDLAKPCSFFVKGVPMAKTK